MEGIRKSFGPVEVLHGIDLDVADGEMIVMVGASGCGKSTLLRLVAGLEVPTEGRILIGGRDVTALEPAERDIAMVFQNYALYPHMTVFGNMAYGLKIRGLPRAEIARRVQEAADLLGIGALLDRRPRQLSGGQRQRVAMGRAIVREPKLFLFDEPLSNLDAKLRVQMRAEIRRLQRRLGVTSLFVTHDQTEAMTLGDRLVVMNAGRAAQVATPMQVWSRPADVFVAGFIGSPAMNFLDATLTHGGTAATLRAGPVLPFADGRRAGPEGMGLVLGIRPEHVLAAAPGEAGEWEAAVTVVVELAEPLGSETVLHGRLPDGEELTARLPAAEVPALGGAAQVSLALRLPAAALHVFEASGGRRLDPVA
ncbi:sn-glycerol-3-phosphate ABC transporter ATP-binding protein UgpC [Roseomonas sp. NAR14]|uniref:Sn-glycerol-3-phosphate ABC transporter ATP-binding protein UgpC n=1 Tax=Roseomonas acroporae TaxID=2937791 RepID=A0A9X1YAZ6_9PROT|nr:sn-glycerol-3-phosphate ABC transporter ATP-binding protein UgpC [Roseomonas acroporae]MCK8785372.1 sn-glycerol-3-phosphate ABC transporter ATP-binding protein UgpC [Roseomonas acroporae]